MMFLRNKHKGIYKESLFLNLTNFSKLFLKCTSFKVECCEFNLNDNNGTIVLCYLMLGPFVFGILRGLRFHNVRHQSNH